jgi:hypothetical protein
MGQTFEKWRSGTMDMMKMTLTLVMMVESPQMTMTTMNHNPKILTP